MQRLRKSLCWLLPFFAVGRLVCSPALQLIPLNNMAIAKHLSAKTMTKFALKDGMSERQELPIVVAELTLQVIGSTETLLAVSGHKDRRLDALHTNAFG